MIVSIVTTFYFVYNFNCNIHYTKSLIIPDFDASVFWWIIQRFIGTFVLFNFDWRANPPFFTSSGVHCLYIQMIIFQTWFFWMHQKMYYKYRHLLSFHTLERIYTFLHYKSKLSLIDLTITNNSLTSDSSVDSSIATEWYYRSNIFIVIYFDQVMC